MSNARPHLLHLVKGVGHLHVKPGMSDDEVRRAFHAARVFLGPTRKPDATVADGLYTFGVDVDGNAIIGTRLKPKPKGATS